IQTSTQHNVESIALENSLTLVTDEVFTASSQSTNSTAAGFRNAVIELQANYGNTILLDGDKISRPPPIEDRIPIINRPMRAKELNLISTWINGTNNRWSILAKYLNLEQTQINDVGNFIQDRKLQSKPQAQIKQLLRVWWQLPDGKANALDLFYALLKMNEKTAARRLRDEMIEHPDPNIIDEVDNDSSWD
ncbi:unnamed protein product, partial [Didymodactylos carnosus]